MARTTMSAPQVRSPGQQYSFGVVEAAQAGADLEALAERGRRALRVHLGSDAVAELARLRELLREAIRTWPASWSLLCCGPGCCPPSCTQRLGNVHGSDKGRAGCVIPAPQRAQLRWGKWSTGSIVYPVSPSVTALELSARDCTSSRLARFTIATTPGSSPTG